MVFDLIRNGICLVWMGANAKRAALSRPHKILRNQNLKSVPVKENQDSRKDAKIAKLLSSR